MARSQRDIVPAAFTVTNSEVVTSFDANTATDTVQSNAIAAIIQALKDSGIMHGAAVS
ncbi:MAG: hypothetical protein KJI69_06070 [Patescibacteria group bacterium]|nr:hypothetical protein [Patescibacteria group bacterium]